MDANAVTIQPASPESPWVTYLTGKKTSAAQFLREMQNGTRTVPDPVTGKTRKQKTHVIPKPDDTVRHQFAEALVTEPSRIERLLLLVQASSSASETIRRIVLDLTEAAIKRLGVIAWPPSPDAMSFGDSVSAWLRTNREKPLKPANVHLLVLLVYVGWHRKWLDHDTALALLTDAPAMSSRVLPTRTVTADAVLTLLDVVLATPVMGAEFRALMAYIDASTSMMKEREAQAQTLTAQVTRLAAHTSELTATVDGLRAERHSLQQSLDEAQETIARLEQHAVDTRASYLHSLDDMRGHIRGTLEGQVTRWLETSLDAVRAHPPRTAVVEERLEDILKLIERELGWLQPSD